MYSDCSHYHQDRVYPCPRCNRFALYQRRPDVFRCIGCGFKKNISSNDGVAPVFAAIMIILFFFFFL